MSSPAAAADLPAPSRPVPPTRRATLRREAAAIRRRRIVAATLSIVGESGYAGLTLGGVLQRARVSRTVALGEVRDAEQCYLVAYKDCIERIAAVVLPGYAAESDWATGVRAALSALLLFFEREPAAARLVIVEVYAAGPAALALRAAVLVRLRELLHGGAQPPSDIPPLVAEALLGAVGSVIHRRLSAEPAPALLELTGPLMQVLARPYLGAEVAEQELHRACAPTQLPSIAATPTERAGELLEQCGIAPTHRTLRVLEVIAERPGMCNRDVASAAGDIDQGQASRLLRRLAGLGVIESTACGTSVARHAWRVREPDADRHTASRASA